MPRTSTTKPVETKDVASAVMESAKEPRFCEITSLKNEEHRAIVRIELGEDISIEIRNADRSMLESYMLEVLTRA